MKKTTLLHTELSQLISSLGHMDMIVIADAGLPVPKGVQKIDLALRAGIPGFIDTLETILVELCVEKAMISNEMKDNNYHNYEGLLRLIGDTPIATVSHEEFKATMKREAVAVIRTGEYTSYSNVILQSGVMF